LFSKISFFVPMFPELSVLRYCKVRNLAFGNNGTGIYLIPNNAESVPVPVPFIHFLRCRDKVYGTVTYPFLDVKGIVSRKFAMLLLIPLES
jgi:hypothetical protein